MQHSVLFQDSLTCLKISTQEKNKTFHVAIRLTNIEVDGGGRPIICISPYFCFLSPFYKQEIEVCIDTQIVNTPGIGASVMQACEKIGVRCIAQTQLLPSTVTWQLVDTCQSCLNETVSENYFAI